MKQIDTINLLAKLAVIYEKEMSELALAVYSENLKDIDSTTLARAMNDLAITRTSRDPFPSIAEIREKCGDRKRDENKEAIEVAGRIVSAISKYGYPNAKEAKEFIGELGWIVVERQGGWVNICQTTTNENIPTLQAQWREMAKAVQYRSAQGKLNEAPKLPQKVANLIENLLEKKDLQT